MITRTAILTFSRRAAGLAFLAALCSCSEPPAPPEPVVRPVKLLTIGDAGATSRREYPGTISPAINAELGFEVAGQITDFPVGEGQLVARGEELARIDPRDYEARLDAAKASVRKAQADLARATSVRREDAGAISLALIDTFRKALEVDEAKEREAAKALEDTVLRAPFAGRVARKLVDDFANVSAKQPVVNLQDDSSIEVVVNLPERDLARGKPAGTREALTERLSPQVSITAVPHRIFPARVKELATSADPTTRTFKLTLAMDRPKDLVVLPGMTGKVSLDVAAGSSDGEARAAVRVPVQAVVADSDNQPYVWVVPSSTMKAERRTVSVGRTIGNEIEVLDGLHPGDRIAISGVEALREGMAVRSLDS